MDPAAKQYGYVNRLVADDKLDDEVKRSRRGWPDSIAKALRAPCS
jgi:hypothetical protein